MYGKKNKFDAKRSSKQSRFPMRTHPLNEELLKYHNDYWADYDFIFMLTVLTVILTFVTSLAKLVSPNVTSLHTNLSLWLCIFTLLQTLQMLSRDAFKLGYTRFTDETKVQILFGVKTFVLVWVTLSYTSIP
jgi:hypothetical protein